jgi:hypothetical protein
MRLKPEFLSLEAKFDIESLKQVIELVVKTLVLAGLPSVQSWMFPADGQPVSATKEGLPECIPGDNQYDAIALQLVDGTQGSINSVYGETGWGFYLLAEPAPNEPNSLPSLLAKLTLVIETFFETHALSSAVISWKGPGARCLPEAPIIGTRTHIIVTDEDKVSVSYADPEAFYRSGWSKVIRTGKRVLLQRALHVRDSVELLEAILDQQWALIRAARQDQIRFFVPSPEPEEARICRSGEQTLFVVGYYFDDQSMELSSAIEPETHVNGWEILDLWYTLQMGETAEGQPLDSVQVVFIDPQAAEQEKRPLLAAGARVFYYNDEGELTEIRT